MLDKFMMLCGDEKDTGQDNTRERNFKNRPSPMNSGNAELNSSNEDPNAMKD